LYWEIVLFNPIQSYI